MPTEPQQTDIVTEARALLAEITPPPWRAWRTSIGYTIKADDVTGPKNGIGLPVFSIQFAKVWETDPNGEGPLPFHANAALIARAPELLRQLADEVEGLRKQIKTMQREAREDALDAAAEARWQERQGEEYGSY